MIEEITPELLEKKAELLVSVVLPIYNGEKYLRVAIDSILAQTFVNFELIMIDDGSTDSSPQILEEYAKRDARVRVIVRENRGLATTLNESVDIARGTWIARMDQDDIALPHRLERQLEWLEETGADISGSWVQRFGSKDNRIVRMRQTDVAIKMEMLFCSPFVHPSVMMRASLIKRLHYDTTREKAEDYDLWERAAEAGWKMTNVPEILLWYRIHASQISTQSAERQQQLGLEIRRRYWEFVFLQMELNKKLIDEVLKISDPSLSKFDLVSAEASFSALLKLNHGESRSVIFDHVTRLYFRAAASCPDIARRWGKLNLEFGSGSGTTTKLMLGLFRLLRIHTDGYVFKQIKKFYVWRESR